MQISNPLHPDRMTAAERLAEVGRILAAGYLRARNRARDNSSTNGEVFLDLPVEGSGHAASKTDRGETP